MTIQIVNILTMWAATRTVSNWSALLHRRVLLEWGGGDDVYLACVHLAGISWSLASDRVSSLRRSPAEKWICTLDKQDAISAPLQLHDDAGLMPGYSYK